MIIIKNIILLKKIIYFLIAIHVCKYVFVIINNNLFHFNIVYLYWILFL